MPLADHPIFPTVWAMRRDQFAATIVTHPINKESTALKLITIAATAAVVALPVAANAAAQPTGPTGSTARKCHTSYKLKCLNPNAYDYDCIGGRGNGPLYTGLVRVVGPDVFRLDADHDGWGCE
jgi:hypothetical protein